VLRSPLSCVTARWKRLRLPLPVSVKVNVPRVGEWAASAVQFGDGQIGRDREGIVGGGGADEGTSNPSGVAGSAASNPLPKTDGGFIGYPQNKAPTVHARTRA
jgi:hypothetical protein